MFDPDEEDQDLKERSRRLFFPDERKLPIFCSAPAAGEFLLLLAEESAGLNRRQRFEQAMGQFWKYVKDGLLHVYMFGSTPSPAFGHATSLQAQDSLLTPTDIAIISCFLSDGEAGTFYTTDQSIITSRAVNENARSMNKRVSGL